jgi:hypothetical protein
MDELTNEKRLTGIAASLLSKLYFVSGRCLVARLPAGLGACIVSKTLRFCCSRLSDVLGRTSAPQTNVASGQPKDQFAF